jgi:hypothetical protein
LKSFQIFKSELKNQKPIAVDVLFKASPTGRQDSMQTVIRTSRRLDSFLQEAAQNFEVFSNIQE